MKKKILHRPKFMGVHPLLGTLSWQGLNPIKLAYQVGWMDGSVNSQHL